MGKLLNLKNVYTDYYLLNLLFLRFLLILFTQPRFIPRKNIHSKNHLKNSRFNIPKIFIRILDRKPLFMKSLNLIHINFHAFFVKNKLNSTGIDLYILVLDYWVWFCKIFIIFLFIRWVGFRNDVFFELFFFDQLNRIHFTGLID